MAYHSSIEWTDATWNVVVGCSKVSAGCDHCYAIRTATRMTAHPNPKVSSPYEGTVTAGEWTGRVNMVHDRLTLPMRWTKPRRIFVNAQSDLFHKGVSDDFIARVLAVMALTPHHTYQVLTKRPARMRALLSSPDFREAVIDHVCWYDNPAEVPRVPWPLPNVHIGVSVEDQKAADLRIPILIDTPAAVRWLSCEPLLGPVDIARDDWLYNGKGNCIDWVVAGGESGPNARPMHPDWARSLRDQCSDAGVPFLFKQTGSVLAREWGCKGKGSDPSGWPESFPREYPNAD